MRLLLVLCVFSIRFSDGAMQQQEQLAEDGGGGGGGGGGSYVNPDTAIDEGGGGGGGGGGLPLETVAPEPVTDPPVPATDPPTPPPTDPPTEPPTDPTTVATTEQLLTKAPECCDAPVTDAPTDAPVDGEPTPAPTAAPTEATTQGLGRCGPFTENGKTYDNRCVTADLEADCNTDSKLPFCTCSTTAWTGLLCNETATTTAAPTTTTTEYKGRCGPYGQDGKTYDNRCRTKDNAASCDMDESKPYCTCTAGWTGTYCAVDPQAFGNLGGNSSGELIDVINVGKNTPARLIASLPALLSFLTDQQRVEMSYSIEEMILDATFEEHPLKIRESFTLFNDPSLGNCFTFNHFNSSQLYSARGAGGRYGLRVTLAFNVDEYVPWVEAVGVFTYIHPIGQNVYLESVKHTMQPGYADQIAMKKYTFTRLRAMFAPACVAKKADSFYFPGEYSVDGCLRSCYQDSVYRSCGCMDPSYARKDGVKACNFEKLACIDEMSDRRGDPYYWPECNCKLPCGEEEYRYETSRAMYTDSSSSNTSRISDITIFLSSLDVYTQVEEWAFPFSRVLGLTGGFAGVLLGASVVFVIEIILLFVRVGLIGCINRDTMQQRKREGED